VFLVTRTPHEPLVARLRSAGVEHGMIGPTDERGWTSADVETPEDGAPVAGSPATVEDALALVDRVADAPWVVGLDRWSDTLPDGVAGVLAARPAPGADPVVVRWRDGGTGDASSAVGPAGIEDDPVALVEVVGALLGLRGTVDDGAETLRELEDLDGVVEVLEELAHLPETDTPASTAGVLVARTDPAFVRAALRRGTRSWVRVPAPGTSVVVQERLPVPRDAEPGDPALAAAVAEHRVQTLVGRGLRPGEAALGLLRAGGATSWTLTVPGDDQRFGNWDSSWTFLDEPSGRAGAYDALVAAFGEPLQPARLRALLDATEWDGDPAAELVHQLGLPDAAVEALDDPDRFRHGAEEVPGLGDGASLAPADRAALAARAPRKESGKVARDVVLLVVGAVLLGLGLALVATDGALVGAAARPGYAVPACWVGGLLALVGGSALAGERSRRRRWVEG